MAVITQLIRKKQLIANINAIKSALKKASKTRKKP